jgi:hypothetical protein
VREGVEPKEEKDAESKESVDDERTKEEIISPVDGIVCHFVNQ